MRLRLLVVTAAAALVAFAGPGCRRTTLVGNLDCQSDRDCAPPDLVCGADGRCLPGCVAVPNACVGGSTCDPTSGECAGGMFGSPCDDDPACDPPAVICRQSTHTCVAGCTISNSCASGEVCNRMTGHCCDPSAADCPRPTDLSAGCNTDSECVGAPANICSGGQCVAGCAQAGCALPLSCNAITGHCAQASCGRDLECDSGSYCTQAASCSVLAFGGAIPCAGGTKVAFRCAQDLTPADFSACVGAPGPGGCPYCLDGSCFHAGLCSTVNDCHRGDTCANGLCFVQAPECPPAALVALADVAAGKLAAGKEVCVTGQVMSARSGYDGLLEFRIGQSPFLFFDIEPMYAQAGVRLPNPGETVTVHGTVRWDAGHNDRELAPVDWVSP